MLPGSSPAGRTNRAQEARSELTRPHGKLGAAPLCWSPIKGPLRHTNEQKTAGQVTAIADDLGLEYVRTLPQEELTRMARTAAGPAPLSNELRSFRAADLVAEARDPEGNTCYLAVEASFTADRRDTQRAIRNADLLQRLTGHNALAVTASVRNNMEAQENIDAGLLHWFQIDE